MSNTNQLVTKSYTLAERHIETIERESDKRSLFNDSAALRQILDEYVVLKAQASNTSKSAPEPKA